MQIKMEKINKSYVVSADSKIDVLREVNLNIKKGELVAIVGKSGSGKSTLMHIMGCLDQQTSGTYYIDESNTSSLSKNHLAEIRNRKIGFVLQEFGLILNKTALENVAVPLYFDRRVKLRDIKIRSLHMLEKVRLADKAYVRAGQLSGGQKQRVSIARALVNNPDIILADEPTGALDSKTSEEIVNLLLQLNAEGKTVIIVTHDVDLANQCNSIFEIKDGLLSQKSEK